MMALLSLHRCVELQETVGKIVDMKKFVLYLQKEQNWQTVNFGGTSVTKLSPREAAQIEAEKTYKAFLQFSKYVCYGALAFLLAVASCSFGVDGTGSKSDPALYEEYKQNMIEMGKQYKK